MEGKMDQIPVDWLLSKPMKSSFVVIGWDLKPAPEEEGKCR
jgi:hypothetical protein